MLELEGINFWAVAVTWLINMGVGAFWYSPAGFAKQWAKHTGVNIMKIPENEATRILLFVALSSLVQALILGVVINTIAATTVTEGLVAGGALWVGFTSATTVGVTLYARKSWKFLWLNSSYFLLVMSLNSVILAVWQ